MRNLRRVPAILSLVFGLLLAPSVSPVTAVTTTAVATTASSMTAEAAGMSKAAKAKKAKAAKEKAAKEKAAKAKAAAEAAKKAAEAKAKAAAEAARKAAEAKAKAAAEAAKIAAAAKAVKACQDAIKQSPIYAPKGLTISCVQHSDPSLHGSNGYSSTGSTTERVWIDISTPNALNMVAHEFSHGYAWQAMTPTLRLEFAKKIGKKTWDDGSYPTRPSEVWAYNQGRCHGYPLNFGYTKVDCSLITDVEAKTKVSVK